MVNKTMLFPLSPLKSLAKQRAQIVKQRNHLSPQIYRLLNVPLPDPSEDVRAQTLISLDFETTGFNPKQDQIISVGWVPITQNVIQLSGAQHFLVKSLSKKNNQQAVIHHILPEMQQQGISLKRIIDILFEQLVGKVVLAHGSVIERQFLAHYTQQQGWPNLPLIWLDTLKIEQTYSRYSVRPYSKPKDDWRLSKLRKCYCLPSYQAHHALSDAIATAELYLAQLQRLFATEHVPIERLMRASL
ncbi:exonuclease domain-containing protein [Vibrio metschnikovii]|uniref:exonuclease domain-containing protein n=1 Tax=Vibrio metschnikovii TaxID=28172 RepID=UPI002FC5BA53